MTLLSWLEDTCVLFSVYVSRFPFPFFVSVSVFRFRFSFFFFWSLYDFFDLKKQFCTKIMTNQSRMSVGALGRSLWGCFAVSHFCAECSNNEFQMSVGALVRSPLGSFAASLFCVTCSNNQSQMSKSHSAPDCCRLIFFSLFYLPTAAALVGMNGALTLGGPAHE